MKSNIDEGSSIIVGWLQKNILSCERSLVILRGKALSEGNLVLKGNRNYWCDGNPIQKQLHT